MSRWPRLSLLCAGLLWSYSAWGDFRGTVLAPDGKPAGGVELKLVRQQRWDERVVVATTHSKEDGVFRFQGIDSPDSRHVPDSLQIVARDASGRFGASENLRLLSYRFEVPAIRLLESVDLSGQVLSVDGAPLAEIKVVPRGVYALLDGPSRDIFLPLLSEEAAAMTAASSAEGRFVIRGLPRGKQVTLRLEAEGYGTQEVVCDLSAEARIRIERTRKIEGRLRGEGVDSAALVGAKLRIASTEWGARHEGDHLARRRWTEVTVSDDGRFLAELTRGKFTASLDEACAAATPLRGAMFEVGDAAAEPIVFPIEPLSPVTGRVVVGDTNKGVEGAWVEIMYVDESGTIVDRRRAITDSDGRYRGYVRKGRVLVSVTYLPESYYPPRRREHFKPESNTPVEYPDLVVVPAGRIDGIVVNEAGEPVADAEVTAPIPDDQFFERMEWPRHGAKQAGPDGRFSLVQIDPNDSVTLFARTRTAASDLTTTVIPGQQKEPVRIVVSEKNSVRIRGVVEDENGPAAGQAVSIRAEYSFSTSERGIRLGLGSAVASATTDERGEFVTPALWADMPYRVSLPTSGGAPIERKVPPGKGGEVIDAGRFVIERATLTVSGRVRDASGKPIAGARVFAGTRGRPQSQQRSDAEGRFRLERITGSTTWVFAEKEGYCLSGQPAAAGAPLEFVLRARSEPPPARRAVRPGRATRERAVHRILDAIEKVPDIRADRSYSTVVRFTAKLDTERAERMSAAAGGAGRQAILTEMIRRLSREDVDETLALVRELPARSAVDALRMCALRLAESDREKALRYAEEAVALARSLDEPERSAALARTGDLLVGLGREEAGAQLISQAAETAEKFGLTGMDSYYRRVAAWAVAPRDAARAMQLVDPIKDDTNRRVGVAMVISRAARGDPEFAAAQWKGMEERFYRDQSAWHVAAAVAARDPQRAVEMARSVGQTAYRTRALAHVAEAIVQHDRKQAYALIEEAIRSLLEEQRGLSFTSLGGGALFGVEVAAIADRIGYPHVDELLLRTLTFAEPVPFAADALLCEATLAGAIGLLDAQMGRQLLTGMRPSFERNPASEEWRVRQVWLAAWAVVDPDEAANIACERLKGYRPDASEFGLSGIGVPEALGVLTVADDERFTLANPMLLNTVLGDRGDEP